MFLNFSNSKKKATSSYVVLDFLITCTHFFHWILIHQNFKAPLRDSVEVFLWMKNVTVLNHTTWVLCKKKKGRKKMHVALCRDGVYSMLGHIFIFIFFPPPFPTPPRSIFLRWSHTCFILCFQCIHCARVVPFYSKLFNSLFFNLFFSPPNRSKMLFSNRVVVEKKKIQMFFFFWCFDVSKCAVASNGYKTLHFLFTTTQHWKGHNFSLTG